MVGLSLSLTIMGWNLVDVSVFLSISGVWLVWVAVCWTQPVFGVDFVCGIMYRLWCVGTDEGIVCGVLDRRRYRLLCVDRRRYRPMANFRIVLWPNVVSSYGQICIVLWPNCCIVCPYIFISSDSHSGYRLIPYFCIVCPYTFISSDGRFGYRLLPYSCIVRFYDFHIVCSCYLYRLMWYLSRKLLNELSII